MNLQIEAINLLLKDLGMIDEALLHRASFHGCSRELQDLRLELRNYLLARRSRVDHQERFS
jgi:hypothetical protein